MLRDQEAMHIAQVMDGISARAHVRACRCALFRISEMTGRITLKFGVWLETHYLGVLQNSRVGTYVRTCARADAPPFPYLGNSGTDRAEIWCVVREELGVL